MDGTTQAPGASYRYDVFISYHPREGDWVWEWLLPRLEDAGLQVGRALFRLGKCEGDSQSLSMAESYFGEVIEAYGEGQLLG